MLKRLMGLTAVAIGAFLLYVALQPAEMFIAREQLIKAPPAEIFPLINNSKKTNDWMPWKEQDPNVHMRYSGAEEGVGSVSTWDSSGEMGTGSATIIESVPNKSVKTQLAYTKPMQMSQVAEISLESASDGTLVRWTVAGKNPFIGRLFCVFMDMDKMVGDQFTKGLTNLKALVEKQGS